MTIQLGDDVSWNFGQDEIYNINKLIKVLKLKLSSEGKIKGLDGVYIDCSIFSTDELVTALDSSLKRFQSLVPEIEEATFLNEDFCVFFTCPLVLGAMLELLPGKALTEAGAFSAFIENENKYNLTEHVSQTILKLIEIESHNYREEIKLIRGNLSFYKNLLKI